MNWTPDKVAELRRLAEHPDKLKSKQIADVLGCGRNPVIGACARYGIKLQHPQHRSYDPNDPPKPRKPRVNRNSIKTRIKMPELTCDGIEPLYLALLKLQITSCRFPYGEGPYTFCGHTKWEGSSYCATHTKLCITTLEERRREPNRDAA